MSARSVSAVINRDILKWARISSGYDIEYAAEKSGLNAGNLIRWESGPDLPTISELRHLAKVFHFPIAVFYLPEPPSLQTIQPKDRRFLPDGEYEEPCPELIFEFRQASERREIALELLSNLETKPKRFKLMTTVRQSAEELAYEIRKMLNIAVEEQTSWRNPRIAFNSWRQKLETKDILVFQVTAIPINQMRGFSLFYDLLPIIAVNRKDAYAARSFTLMHELVHLVLRKASLCDVIEKRSDLSQEDQLIEVFCNNVAACTLVPQDALLSDDNLKDALTDNIFGERAIRDISIRFSVSREVIVRRMLSLGLVNEGFYKKKRAEYLKEIAHRPPKKGGFVHPVVDVLSYAGRPFVTLALENFNRGNITTSDVSDYLGVKIKHIGRLGESVFGA